MSKFYALFPLHNFEVSNSSLLPDEITITKKISIIKLSPGFEFNAFEPQGDFYSKFDEEIILRSQYAIKVIMERNSEAQKKIATNFKSRILMSLRLLRPTAVCATSLFYEENSRDVRVYSFTRSSYQDSFYPKGYKPKDITFVADDVEQIIKNSKFVLSLFENYGGKYHKILNALIFVELSYRSQDYKPMFILLVSVLESLFNSGKNQINYTFCERLALLNGKDYDDKIKIFKRAKKIYNVRSCFVHGNTAGSSFSQNQLNSGPLLLDLDRYWRDSIQKIINDDLTHSFDKDTHVDDFFKKLIFN